MLSSNPPAALDRWLSIITTPRFLLYLQLLSTGVLDHQNLSPSPNPAGFFDRRLSTIAYHG